jgi:hypothetical protein
MADLHVGKRTCGVDVSAVPGPHDLLRNIWIRLDVTCAAAEVPRDYSSGDELQLTTYSR